MVVTRYAIRFRTAVFVLIANLVLAGLLSFFGLPREMTPDIEIPVVVVSVPYPGASPVDVEQLILTPLETELEDLRDIEKMEGSAYEGAGVVVLTFTPEANIDEALTGARDRVSRVRPKLPADILDPTVKEISFSDFPILIINISADYSLERLKRFAKEMQDDIETVPGVLSADVSGGVEEQVTVAVNPEAAALRKVSLGDVVRAVQGENINLPGGQVEAQSTSWLVRTPADFRDAAGLREVVVKSPGGRPVKLTDIATIRRSFTKPTSYARFKGRPSVSVQVTKRVGANIVDVVDKTKEVVERYEAIAPNGTEITLLNDQSVFIRNLVDDLVNNIITGLILVILVIFFFLGGRNAVLVSVAVPLSMLLTFSVLDIMGVTLNLVTLFALILALGMLVDNAIVVVENIYRHLGERLEPGSSASLLRRMRIVAAYTGTAEVAWPVIASTATTVAAFAPLLFWPGIMGKFMSYLPMVIIITLVASLAVALVINPVMAGAFMARPSVQGTPSVLSDRWREGFPGPIARAYHAVLTWAVDAGRRRLFKPVVTVFLAFATMIGSIVAFGASGLGVEFFPETTPDRATIAIKAPNGTHLDGSDAIVRQVEAILADTPNVESWVATPGASADAFKSGGSSSSAHLSGISLDFHERIDRVESTLVTIDTLRERVSHIAGAHIEVVREKMGPPAGAPVSIELTGTDYDRLGRLSQRAIDLLKSMHDHGVRDARTDYVTGRPELQVRVDRQAAKEVGASTFVVAQAIRDAIHGNDSSVIRDGHDEYDIVIRHEAGRRDRPGDLSSVFVKGRDDAQIPLDQLTRVVRTSGSGTIRHKDTRLTVKVDADIAPGANANRIRATIAERLDGALKAPAGYRWQFGGENVEQDKAARFLSRALMIGVFAILIILVTQFNSILKPAIIISSVLLSLVGVFAGLMATRQPFGVIMTGLGVISLAGVVVNNAIVLIDYIEQLRKGGLDAYEAVVRAGLTRLRPVLLTALTTILGLVPMAMGWSFNFLEMRFETVGSSGEFWGGMATAVIFGLAFATGLTLVVVPALYLVLDRLGRAVARLTTGSDQEVDLEQELELAAFAGGAGDDRERGGGGAGGAGLLLLAVLGAGLLVPSTTTAQGVGTLALAEPPGAVQTLELPALLKMLDAKGPDLAGAKLRLAGAVLIVDRAWAALQPNIDGELAYRLNDPVLEVDFFDSAAAEAQAKGQVQGHIDSMKAIKAQFAANGQSTGVLDQAIAAQEAYRDGISVPAMEPIQISRRHGLSATLKARMSLFDMRTLDGLSMAKKSAALARAGHKLTRLELQHAVTRAWLGARLQRKALTVIERRLQSARVTLNASRQRLAAGVSTPLATRMAEMSVLQAERAAAGSQLAYRSAVAALGLLVGANHRFDVGDKTRLKSPGAAIEGLQKTARKRRLELTLNRDQAEFAKLRAAEARNRWWPRLGLYAQGQWQNASGFGDQNTSSMLMVTLSQQLWDAGQSGLDRKAALLEASRLKVEADQSRRRIAAEVRGAAAQLQVTRKDAVAARKSAEVARQALSDARSGLEAGTNTELDLRRVEDSLIEAELGQVNKEVAVEAAVLGLRRALGLGPLDRAGR